MTALVMEPRETAGKDAANDVVATGFVAVPHGLIASPVSDQAVLMWVLLANMPTSVTASALAIQAASRAAEKAASEAADTSAGTQPELPLADGLDVTEDTTPMSSGPDTETAGTKEDATASEGGDVEAIARVQRYGWRRVTHASLSRRAGWSQVSPATASQRWCRACRELVEAGWVRTCTASVLVPAIEQRITVPLYQVGDTTDRALFEQLPRQVLSVLVGADADTGLLVRHWLVWRMSAGARGWTAVTVPTVAAHLGVRAERVSGVLAILADLGVLSVTRRPGRATVVAFGAVGQNQQHPQAPRLEQVLLEDPRDAQHAAGTMPAVIPVAPSPDAATSETTTTLSDTTKSADVGAAVTQIGAGENSAGGATGPGTLGQEPPLHLSDHPTPQCRITLPRFVGHVLDSSSHHDSHTMAKPVETLTKRAHDDTAAMRPNHDITAHNTSQPTARERRTMRLDTADQQAMGIVAGLQAVAGQPKLRGQLRCRIAALLRRYPSLEPGRVGVAIAEAFHDAATSIDGIGMRHVELVNQAIANVRADQIAAPTPDLVPAAGTSPRSRPSQTAGPCLADLLSDQAHPAPGPDEDATDWAVARIARYVHDQEPALRARALELYPRHLRQVVGHYPEIYFAAQVVARALANEQLA